MAALRDAIDALDTQLVALMEQRAEQALAVGRLKAARGLPVYAPERERAVGERVAALAQGLLPAGALLPVWREIMAACRAAEAPFRVAFLGPAGTFSHQAALAHFGEAIAAVPCPDLGDVFHTVERGDADVGVVPVENSTEGSVTETHDRLLDTPLLIEGEHTLAIHQRLAAKEGTALSDVRIVLSHPQALAQTRGWLGRHLPEAAVREVASTALAAERASREHGAAAVVGEACARLYGLATLARAIEDRPENATRFLLLGRRRPAPTGRDRTSVTFEVKNEAGSLYNALAAFKRHDVNLSRIESRPARAGTWSYVFFVDLEGHRDEPRIRAALEDVERHTSGFRCLGSYPRARPSGDAVP